MNCQTTASTSISTSNQRSNGFTLVEVLAAGVILALSAVALALTVSNCTNSLALARDYQRAAELLDRTFTKIDLIGPSLLLYEGPTQGTFEEPHQKFAWQADIDSRLQGHLYEVTVSISWQTPSGRQQSIKAQTLLNDPPDSNQTEIFWEDL